MQTSKVVVESGLSVICTEIATDEIVAVQIGWDMALANELIVSDTLTQLRARSAFFKMIKDDLCKGISFKRG